MFDVHINLAIRLPVPVEVEAYGRTERVLSVEWVATGSLGSRDVDVRVLCRGPWQTYVVYRDHEVPAWVPPAPEGMVAMALALLDHAEAAGKPLDTEATTS